MPVQVFEHLQSANCARRVFTGTSGDSGTFEKFNENDCGDSLRTSWTKLHGGPHLASLVLGQESIGKHRKCEA